MPLNKNAKRPHIRKPERRNGEKQAANLNASPMEQLQHIASEHRGYRLALYTHIADACRVKDLLVKAHAWREFVQDSFWEGRKDRPQMGKPSLRLWAAFEVAFADTEPKIRSEYHLVAKYLLKEYRPDQIVDQLTKPGGIRRVLNEARVKPSATPSPATSELRVLPCKLHFAAGHGELLTANKDACFNLVVSVKKRSAKAVELEIVDCIPGDG